jgi:aldose 1-epimerase
MDATRIFLRLASTGPGPFHYEAALGYRIDERALITTLAVTNTGQESLPFGLGFHPWFPRTAATVLQAPARAVWAETDRHLRSGSAPVGIPEEWDFAKPRPLPEAWINNSFVGWDGHARIAWPDRGIALDVTARGLETYVLFSPNGAAEYFCFEPVSHVVDAHNLPGEAANNGLIVLASGEGTEVRCRLTPHFDRA